MLRQICSGRDMGLQVLHGDGRFRGACQRGAKARRGRKDINQKEGQKQMTEYDYRLIENIKEQMRLQDKKQVDLAAYMNLPRQTIYKIMTRTRMVSAVELKLIADFLGVPMDRLMDSGAGEPQEDPLLVFRQQVSGREAQQGFDTAEELMDMYLAQRKILEGERKQE